MVEVPAATALVLALVPGGWTLAWAALAAVVLYVQLYAMIMRFLRLLLHTYFRKIAVFGVNNFPREGPVILCPNHPNMLVDAILILSEAARYGRFAYVWTKGSLFANPLVGSFLRKFGAVPVFRPRRASDSLTDVDSNKSPEELETANHAMFEQTWEVLAAGNVMVLFPEGTSYTAPKMLALRTGVVRVATGFAKHYDRPIPIIPVGLNYFNKDHFRSQVALEFGKPMVISPDDVNSDAFKFDEYAEVKRLTGCLEEKMRDVTLNASDFGTIKIARSMRRLYLNTPGSIAANEEVRLTQHIIDMLEKPSVKEEQQQKIADVRAKVEKYREELGRLRMKDQEIILPVEKKNSLLQVFLERALYLLVLLPLATPGIVLHFPYYFVASKMNALAGFVESKSQFKIFAAGVLIPAHWFTLIVAAWLLLGPPYAYAMAVVLPVLLYSHIRVLEEGRSLAENVRFIFHITAHADEVAALRKQRDLLAREVHDLVSECVDPKFLTAMRKSLSNSPPRQRTLRHRQSSTSDIFQLQ